MVKGVSRQVFVVKSPDGNLFEQAIFILRENAEGVTDEMLLKEAQKIATQSKRSLPAFGPLWAGMGAACTALVWLLTAML